MSYAHWLVPELSLMTEAKREMDRRKAVKLKLVDLQILADRLIVDCYNQRDVVDRCLARVGELEARLALVEGGVRLREGDVSDGDA
jgi:hypothetical protein